MGNSLRALVSTSRGDDAEQRGRDFETICDPRVSQVDRRAAFDRLRNTYCPNTSATLMYRDELARVMGQQYTPWNSLPSRSDRPHVIDAIKGCIYGCAVGDATGLSTEFLSKETVLSHYGTGYAFMPGCEVYADSHRMGFTSGDWTDDTDQLILILICMLENRGRISAKSFGAALLNWKDNGFSGLGDEGAGGLGRSTKTVLCHPHFLLDPSAAARDVWEKTGRRLAPNGVVMRTAVTGIPFYWDSAVVAENTITACTTTHADPRCVASCLVISHIISNILRIWEGAMDTDGVDRLFAIDSVESIIEAAVRAAETRLDSAEQIEELQGYTISKAMKNAKFSDLGLDDPRSIGYTYKCLSTGTTALRHTSHLLNNENISKNEIYARIISDVVLQGGDADTNAAVVGSIVGCCLGAQNIPGSWISQMPYVRWLDAWIEKLVDMMTRRTA